MPVSDDLSVSGKYENRATSWASIKVAYARKLMRNRAVSSKFETVMRGNRVSGDASDGATMTKIGTSNWGRLKWVNVVQMKGKGG